MLPIDGLMSAGVPTSKNQRLKDLWAAVMKYNSPVANMAAKFELMSGGVPHQQAMSLRDVMVKAALYLTDKPPQERSRKNAARWGAITALAEAAVAEATRLGIKMVEGPADFRTINSTDGEDNRPCVWLEVLDRQHREMGGLSADYHRWLNDPTCIREKKSFWKYIGDYEDADRVAYNRAGKFLVQQNAGQWIDGDESPVDTISVESFHSGSGWGIYACDTRRRLYVGHHSNDDYAWIRHTSLAAAAPVLAAGEIVFDKGQIVALSNETGHYRLPWQQFLQFICSFTLIPNNAVIKIRASKDEVCYALASEIRRGMGRPTCIPWKDRKWAKGHVSSVKW